MTGNPYEPAGAPGSATGTVQYLNPAAFAPAPDGRFGDMTRGNTKLQVQADVFNVFNQTELRFGT